MDDDDGHHKMDFPFTDFNEKDAQADQKHKVVLFVHRLIRPTTVQLTQLN